MLPERQQAADMEIRHIVLEALAANGYTAPLKLRVGVLNGIVHLAGQAPSLEIWNLAESLAVGIPGVRGVVNRIQAPGAPSPARTIILHLDKESPANDAVSP